MATALVDVPMHETPAKIQPDTFLLPTPFEGGSPPSFSHNTHETTTTSFSRTNNRIFRTGANRALNHLISGNDDDGGFSDEEDDNDHNINEGGDGRMELEEELELHYTIFVGLPLGTPRDNIWLVLKRARNNVLQHIENGEFGSRALSIRNGSYVLRCDASFKSKTIEMAGEGNDIEFVLNSLEQWFFTLLDMQVQGANIRIPWMAGPWSMNWLLFLLE